MNDQVESPKKKIQDDFTELYCRRRQQTLSFHENQKVWRGATSFSPTMKRYDSLLSQSGSGKNKPMSNSPGIDYDPKNISISPSKITFGEQKSDQNEMMRAMSIFSPLVTDSKMGSNLALSTTKNTQRNSSNIHKQDLLRNVFQYERKNSIKKVMCQKKMMKKRSTINNHNSPINEESISPQSKLRNASHREEQQQQHSSSPDHKTSSIKTASLEKSNLLDIPPQPTLFHKESKESNIEEESKSPKSPNSPQRIRNSKTIHLDKDLEDSLSTSKFSSSISMKEEQSSVQRQRSLKKDFEMKLMKLDKYYDYESFEDSERRDSIGHELRKNNKDLSPSKRGSDQISYGIKKSFMRAITMNVHRDSMGQPKYNKQRTVSKIINEPLLGEQMHYKWKRARHQLALLRQKHKDQEASQMDIIMQDWDKPKGIDDLKKEDLSQFAQSAPEFDDHKGIDYIFDAGFYNFSSPEVAKRIKSARLINPEKTFMKIWNSVMFILMIYTALIMPYKVSFVDDKYFWWDIFDTTIDMLFLVDVMINFNLPYFDHNNALICNRKQIALNYVKGWLLIDITSSIPMQLFEITIFDDSFSNDLIKLARLPRIYRLLRIARLLKVFRIVRKMAFINKLKDHLDLSLGAHRMIQFAVLTTFITHLVSCFWYLIAKIDNLGPDTWVYRNNMLDADNLSLYLAGQYQTFQTLMTVGYGDINSYTNIELIYACSWMFVGSLFYTFAIGNLSNLVTQLDSRESTKANKLATLSEFCREAKLSKELRGRLIKTIEYASNKNLFSWVDKQKVFQELPTNLKSTIALQVHSGIIQSIKFFDDKDSTFIGLIVPLLQPRNADNQEIIYLKHNFPNFLFFIIKGRVSYFLDKPFTIKYKDVVQGAYFGEQEIIQKSARLYNVMAVRDCEFLTMSKQIFETYICSEYPNVLEEMTELTFKRDQLIKRAKTKAKEEVVRMVEEEQKQLERSTSTLKTDKSLTDGDEIQDQEYANRQQLQSIIEMTTQQNLMQPIEDFDFDQGKMRGLELESLIEENSKEEDDENDHDEQSKPVSEESKQKELEIQRELEIIKLNKKIENSSNQFTSKQNSKYSKRRSTSNFRFSNSSKKPAPSRKQTGNEFSGFYGSSEHLDAKSKFNILKQQMNNSMTRRQRKPTMEDQMNTQEFTPSKFYIQNVLHQYPQSINKASEENKSIESKSIQQRNSLQQRNSIISNNLSRRQTILQNNLKEKLGQTPTRRNTLFSGYVQSNDKLQLDKQMKSDVGNMDVVSDQDCYSQGNVPKSTAGSPLFEIKLTATRQESSTDVRAIPKLTIKVPEKGREESKTPQLPPTKPLRQFLQVDDSSQKNTQPTISNINSSRSRASNLKSSRQQSENSTSTKQQQAKSKLRRKSRDKKMKQINEMKELKEKIKDMEKQIHDQNEQNQQLFSQVGQLTSSVEALVKILKEKETKEDKHCLTCSCTGDREEVKQLVEDQNDQKKEEKKKRRMPYIEAIRVSSGSASEQRSDPRTSSPKTNIFVNNYYTYNTINK